MIELVVVMAILGLVTVSAVPRLLGYWQGATVKAAAEELAAGLNRARQLAISQAQRVCVEVVNNRYRFRMTPAAGNPCTGNPWRGVGSDVAGFFRLANNVTLIANVYPIFDYLGAANPGATLTVINPRGGATLSVVVSVAGRVRICPVTGCS